MEDSTSLSYQSLILDDIITKQFAMLQYSYSVSYDLLGDFYYVV